MPVVAVYGTLRRGGVANHMMRGSTFLGQDKIKGTLYRVGWFPGLELTDSGEEVVADLYEVSEAQKKALDRYEGYIEGNPGDSLFIRRPITTVGGVKAEAYEYSACQIMPDETIIKSGDWFDEAQ